MTSNGKNETSRPRPSRFARRMRVLRWMMLIYTPAVLVLAFWPVPLKYPYMVPIVLVVAGASAWFQIRYRADDVAASFIVVMAAVGLAAMTVRHWLGLSFLPTVGVGMAGAVLPTVFLVMALIAAGSADNPYVEDPYDTP